MDQKRYKSSNECNHRNIEELKSKYYTRSEEGIQKLLPSIVVKRNNLDILAVFFMYEKQGTVS